MTTVYTLLLFSVCEYMYRTIFASCVFTPGAHAYLAHRTSGVDYLEMSVRPDVRALLAARAIDGDYNEAEENVERVLIRLESLYVDLIEIDLCECVSPSSNSVLSNVFESCQLLRESLEPSFLSGPGRPAFEIQRSCIENLMEIKFTAAEIAAILGVSRSTVCRRMRQYGLSYSTNYCCISDDDRDDIVRSISLQHPGCGSKMMEGHLRAQGVTLQQIRIRESLRRTDPEGTATRFYANIRRRVYDVTSPQSLWHIDGNHKLVQYAIDAHRGMGISHVAIAYCVFSFPR